MARGLAVSLLTSLACIVLTSAASGEVAYEDDFSSPVNSGWPIYCDAAPGEFCFPISRAAGLDWVWIPRDIKQAHFAFKTGARDYTSAEVEYGLLWGSPGGRCYFALINPNEKTYRIGLVKSDGTPITLEHGASRFIKSGTQLNTVQVVISGDQMELSINGITAHVIEIANRGEVSFALAASSLSASVAEIRFDYLRLESFEAPVIVQETIEDVEASCGIDMVALGRWDEEVFLRRPDTGEDVWLQAIYYAVMNIGTATAPRGTFKFRLVVMHGGGVVVFEEPQSIPWPPGEEILVGFPDYNLGPCPFPPEGIVGIFEIIPLRQGCDEDLSNNENEVFREYGEEFEC